VDAVAAAGDGREGLEAQFHDAMLGVYKHARTECRYTATRFLQFVSERGGLQAARDLLLRGNEVSSGLGRLWECGRLDLTMEALVIREPWRRLFSEEELTVARTRLDALGYLPPSA
jgi:hypothetical protein